ncbi:M48 family metallopeptidase [Corynebacterium sp. P5848]|uniref:M48 family metallopeptidase n=1 Tax=Corynebacterium marambiense TaxID=2765364 RepID=UPI002260E4EA|nr:M48 family metallopeptidase [Corynebacterium marambiense]MCX7541796.1 M48 family metallopeptidase [Corynebacterium marambiense]
MTTFPPASPTGVDRIDPTLRELRHRREWPLVILGLVLTAIVATAAIGLLISGYSLNDWATGVLLGLITPIAALVFIRMMYWKTAANSIQITENQLPELHAIYTELGEWMGFNRPGGPELPNLYLHNGNGTMNTYASKCRMRAAYIVLYSGIVDLAYTHDDFGALRFIPAHELGHVKCRHVSLWRLIYAPIMTLLFLNKSTTRAQEYTADRVAASYAPDDVLTMIHLFAGKNLGHRIDLDEYFRTVDGHKEGFWLRFANFRSDHAIGFRRMTTLRRTLTKGWNVHGKMI